jgi:hypothetical protein
MKTTHPPSNSLTKFNKILSPNLVCLSFLYQTKWGFSHWTNSRSRFISIRVGTNESLGNVPIAVRTLLSSIYLGGKTSWGLRTKLLYQGQTYTLWIAQRVPQLSLIFTMFRSELDFHYFQKHIINQGQVQTSNFSCTKCIRNKRLGSLLLQRLNRYTPPPISTHPSFCRKHRIPWIPSY